MAEIFLHLVNRNSYRLALKLRQGHPGCGITEQTGKNITRQTDKNVPKSMLQAWWNCKNLEWLMRRPFYLEMEGGNAYGKETGKSVDGSRAPFAEESGQNWEWVHCLDTEGDSQQARSPILNRNLVLYIFRVYDADDPNIYGSRIVIYKGLLRSKRTCATYNTLYIHRPKRPLTDVSDEFCSTPIKNYIPHGHTVYRCVVLRTYWHSIQLIQLFTALRY